MSAGLTILAAAVAAVGAGYRQASAIPARAADAAYAAGHDQAPPPLQGQARPHKEQLGSEAVTITRQGFEPGELTRPAGRFFLSVENRSGRRGLTLLVDAEHGSRVRSFTQPDDELDWADELDLTPGRYTLTTVERPDWVCHLTVTPK